MLAHSLFSATGCLGTHTRHLFQMSCSENPERCQECHARRPQTLAVTHLCSRLIQEADHTAARGDAEWCNVRLWSLAAHCMCKGTIRCESKMLTTVASFAELLVAVYCITHDVQSQHHSMLFALPQAQKNCAQHAHTAVQVGSCEEVMWLVVWLV